MFLLFLFSLLDWWKENAYAYRAVLRFLRIIEQVLTFRDEEIGAFYGCKGLTVKAG